MNHIEKSRELGLDPSEYILVGGSVLDIYGVRKSNDIDVVVSNRAFQTLKDRGWEVDQTFKEKWGNERLVHDVFEVVKHFNWNFCDYHLSFEAVRDIAKIIDGVHVQPLGLSLVAKYDIGREKDFVDIKLIEQYFSKQNTKD